MEHPIRALKLSGILTCLLVLTTPMGSWAKTPVYFCNDPNWVPIDYTDGRGQARGIAVDILRYLFDHYLTDYRLIHWKTHTWNASLQAFRKRKCVLLAEAIATPERRRYMLFTQPILEYPLVFITRKDYPMLQGLDDIGQATVVRQKGSALISLLRRRLPNVKIMEVPDTASAYLAVSAGKADIAIAVAPVARAMISQLALDNLVVNGKTGLSYPIRIAVHKTLPKLRDQLDAAIRQMPLSERVRIQSFYTSDLTPLNTPPKNSKDDPKHDVWKQLKPHIITLFALVLASLSLGLLLILWRQKRKIQEQTLDALTQLPTRHLFNERLVKLTCKASPKTPLCLIAADIDHFKRINDQYGHLKGDKVLKTVAQIMRKAAQTRKGDLLVRWGGEEFMWLCPNTSFKQACGLAEWLREQVQLAFKDHPELPQVTLSAGVAQYQRGESVEQFIQRADEALYRAKRLGRNRVSCAQTANTSSF